MAIPKLLQGLVNTAKTSATVVKKNTENKANKALGGLVTTQKETMPQARAKALLPGLVKVAETTGKIGKANVANQQAKAKELLQGLVNTAISTAGQVKQEAFQKQDNAIGELGATVLENPNVEPSKLKQAFPEFANLPDDILGELGATVLENPNVTPEQLRQAFPELEQTNKPQEKSSVVSDVIGGAYRSVVDLPQSISESGILDRPAEYLAQGPVGEAIRSGAKSLFGEQAVKQYQTKEGGKKFSEVAKGMVVGDPTSDVYQGTRVAGDVAQIGIGAAQAVKSIAKNAAKKNVLNIIKEGNTAANKRLAVREGRLTPAIKQSFFRTGKESIVQPTKKSIQATDTIVKLIKNPSKDPAKLFTQIDSKIGDISNQLAPKLREVKVTGNISNNITKPIKELTKLTDEFTTTEISKMNGVISKLKKADNLDDVWKIRKEFDGMFSDAVKNATDLSAPSTRKANKLRTVVRNELNDKIETIGSTISDVGAKKEFKTMSDLYHGLSNITKRGAESNIVSKEIPSTFKNLLKKGARYGGIGLAGYLGAKAGFKGSGGGSSYTNE